MAITDAELSAINDGRMWFAEPTTALTQSVLQAGELRTEETRTRARALQEQLGIAPDASSPDVASDANPGSSPPPV